MHNTRLRSELLDSLDYLIPPVKKLPQVVYKDLLYNGVRFTNQSLISDCHRTVFANKDPFSSKSSESDVQTCSSLILKKTTKQLIHEQYSILNLSTCNREPNLCFQNNSGQRIFHSKEEKPTIKVTVIPKVQETQTSKVFNNRCRYYKRVQSTVSNQDNSIKNQNVYLLVKGQKRGKVNELKLSESAKFSDRSINYKYGDISMEQITESRQIINSLNMDKRKRKDNKNKALKKHISDDRESPKIRYHDKFSNANDRKNRVSVVGELGLTQDDRYVLKCAVNDKPIETNFLNDDANPMRLIKNHNFHQSSSQYRPTGCNVNNCEALRQFRQQNCNIQTNIANPYYLRSATSNNRVASQSTQVNFNFQNPPSIKKFRNQIAQCNCNLSTTADPLDTEVGDKVVKKCKSPLVIISVYPRQDKGTDENDTVKIIQRQTSPERKEVSNIMRSNITLEKFKQLNSGKFNANKKVETKLPRSLSPSPKRKIETKKNIENKTDTKGRNNNSMKNDSPSGTRSNKSYIINNLQEHTSCHCNSKFLQPEYFNRQQGKLIKDKSKDTEEVKKALVNSFLRNVNVVEKDNTNSKKFRPAEDASKVTININGENDNYDVLLQHSYYDTGVSVKKTRKVRPPESFSSEEEVNTKSLENFLLVSHERMKKNEYNQETERTQHPDVLKIKPTSSRLNIKDSIEICRRQEEQSNYRLKPRSKHNRNDFDDAILNSDSYELSFSAQVKHYRGDNCSLSDPNERDREIRELLGIMRCQRLPDTEHTECRKKTKERGCCCNRKCSTGLMTGISISKFFTSKCFKRKTKNADMQHETTQIGPNAVEEETKEKTEPSHKDKRKSNISKKTKITEKSEDKHISESPEPLNTTEEETTETTEATAEDSSQDQEQNHIEHKEHDNATHDKRISHRENRISKATTKKEHNGENRISKATTKKEHSREYTFSKKNTIKEQSEKLNHPSTIMDDKVMSQNLILNRNIQIFLQVEQFNKKKPVMLTRQQYEKVKRIIECTISKKLSIQKRKRCSLKNCNVVSIGEIKVKPQLQVPLRFDRALQTDRTEINKQANFITDKFKAKKTRTHNTKHIKNKNFDKHIETHVMATERHNIEQVYPRQAVSSMEIRYASVEYKKHVIISSSSTRFKNDIIHSLHTSNAGRNSNSIHTIFKGHKRSATPNLGTSAYSLYSNFTDFSNKSYKQPQCAGDFKPKKPFLQRLISCLVMRSTQTSNIKEAAQKRKVPSVVSSLDSYHISTSLGALEMTSSLYDTSASFYSNHTTMPVNKIKRGFFSSVRGFLTSRRS